MLPPCSVCQLYVFTQTLFHYQSQFSDIVRDYEAAKGIRRHAMDADTNVDVVGKLNGMTNDGHRMMTGLRMTKHEIRMTKHEIRMAMGKLVGMPMLGSQNHSLVLEQHKLPAPVHSKTAQVLQRILALEQ